MKRIIYILLILSAALNAYHAKGQNCPTTPTYKNQSGTFDLSSGRSIVLNNGGSYQITIQNNFYANASICVTNGSTLTLQFQNVNTVQKGGSIYVDKTSKLVFAGSTISNFPFTLTNAGTVNQSTSITFTDGATITNSGSYSISTNTTLSNGIVTISNSGNFDVSSSIGFNTGSFSITNAANATMQISSGLTIAYTTIKNSGTLNISGAVKLQGSSNVTNNSYLNISGDLNVSSATVTNNGVLSIAGSSVINTGSSLINTCTIKEAGNIGNNGTVNNSGTLIMNGTLTNQGLFINTTAGFVQGVNFINNNSISGGGNFYFSGNTTNQGTFIGGDNGINFYDATLNNGNKKYFDVQNVTPVNTTKNKISPNTSASFSPCAESSLPVITTQPVAQLLCSSANTSATFSVIATSNNTPTYQWYKNDVAISGATAASYTATALTFNDTLNNYSVKVTNAAGSTTSNSVSVKYIIVSQPLPLSQYLATGNSASFSGLKVSNATSMQWQKDGSSISGATSSMYSISTVNYADSGKYTVLVTYNGGTCTSDAAVLKTSIILYSKGTGKLNQPGNWGVNTDGSGSSPVNFTRGEHTFVIANRAEAETGADINIAGTLDIANAQMSISPNTTLHADKITRSLSFGLIIASATSNLIVGNGSTSAAQSDLYFDVKNNTLKNLTINAKNVVLHTALNLTSGKAFGVLQVAYGTFNTSDLLTLKSDSSGTAGIAKSAGTIIGKVTIEKWIHSRRAWRLIGAPVSGTDAQTINAAWQEGATSSSANPVPGFGTHITGGTQANGFDISPTNNASIKYLSKAGQWTGLANTNKTLVTQYPAYMLFVRGNRSYNISGTTKYTTPMTTVLRIKGNVYQGTMAAKAVSASGYTMVVNPYASPINFSKVISASSNVKKRIRVWDPTLAGENGVGGWVIVDGTTGTYRSTPPSTYVSTVLQAGQGFIIESANGKTNGSLALNEDDKDFTVNTISSDRVVGSTTDTSLEVNLKLFNTDSTASIADGILYNFSTGNNDSADVNDALKLYNNGENIVAKNGSQDLAIDSRTAPKEGDSLALNLYNMKAASYQIEFVPSLLTNKTFALYDKYLNTLTAISSVDTTRITFSILSSVNASKATDRFTIVTQKSKAAISLPAAQSFTFIKVKAEAKNKAINVGWNVENESAVLYYTVEKSTDGVRFTEAGNVVASLKGTYSYTDATPASGMNYYRIKGITKTGSQYAPVVSGSLNAATAVSLNVYPNPLTGTTFTATLSNLSKGTYTLSVVNSSGTTVAVKTLAHNGGTASQKVTLNNHLAAGVYYINLSAAGNTISTTKITAL